MSYTLHCNCATHNAWGVQNGAAVSLPARRGQQDAACVPQWPDSIPGPASVWVGPQHNGHTMSFIRVKGTLL